MLSGSRRAGEEPLARVPTGVYSHDDGRSMLGRKLKGESVRELHDLGLLVDGGGDQTGASAPITRPSAPITRHR